MKVIKVNLHKEFEGCRWKQFNSGAYATVFYESSNWPLTKWPKRRCSVYIKLIMVHQHMKFEGCMFICSKVILMKINRADWRTINRDGRDVLGQGRTGQTDSYIAPKQSLWGYNNVGGGGATLALWNIVILAQTGKRVSNLDKTISFTYILKVDIV